MTPGEVQELTLEEHGAFQRYMREVLGGE